VHIWILNHYVNPPGGVGGTRHLDIAKGLASLGNHVTIFASDYDHGRKERHSIREYNIVTNKYGSAKLILLPTTPYRGNGLDRVLNMISYAPAMLLESRKHSKPDIIVGSSVHLLAPFVGAILARRYNIPFCFEIRDVWPATLIEIGGMHKLHPIVLALKQIELFLYRRSDHVISLLPSIGPYLSSNGINQDNWSFIPNGVDIDRFDEAAQNEELSIPKEWLNANFRFAYAGAHGKPNALDTIIDGIALAYPTLGENAHFIFVGDGTEKNRLEKRCRDLGLQRVVHFTGYISKNKVPFILKNASVLLVSMLKSDIYKYGVSLNKLFDYMAAARPIIFCGNSESVPGSKSGGIMFVPPEDPEALANKIIEVVKMPLCKLDAMGQKAREYVEVNHNIKYLANKFSEALEKAIKMHASNTK